MAPATDSAVPIGTALTLEQWAALPEDDEGELVDGYLVDEEVPDYLHELVVAWLIHRLASCSRAETQVASLPDRG